MFLNSDNNEISHLAQLSVYPTFLFYGYPGTGKSSVANIVYEKLRKEHNIDIFRLNIDELISYNFGESSSNLRKYFKERSDEIKKNKSHCFIIMDEIDSFTINRYKNDNESIKRILLTFNLIIDELVRSDEIYQYIIIATTNLKESIDTSVLRRFFFKEDFNIEIDKEAFKKLLIDLIRLTNLTYKKSFIDDVFGYYVKKKYTIGEIKYIISKAYVYNLAFDGCSQICEKDFSEYQTYHEINQNQK